MAEIKPAPDTPDVSGDIPILKKDEGGQNDDPSKPKPSADAKTDWDPTALQSWYTVSMGVGFILVAIASEIVSHHHGFRIPLDDSERSSAIQAFKSFAPSTIFGLLFALFTPSYNAVKLLDPELDSADDDPDVSVRAAIWDFLGAGPFPLILRSVKKHRWTFAILSFIALSENLSLFSSLGGAYFLIVTDPQSHRSNVIVTVSGTVGNNVNNLPSIYPPFVSAAGSVDTILRGGVAPSPYLLNNTASWWMVPSFALADQTAPVQGGNISTDISAVMVQAKCAPASSISVGGPSNISGSTVYSVTGTLPNGCNATAYTPVENVGTWFGWAITPPYQCVKGINPEDTTPARQDDNLLYRPVAFSFFKTPSVYSMVFCYSSLVGYNVTASYSFNAPNNGISNVVNKTVASPLGYGPNGLIFPGWENNQRIVGVGDSVRLTLADAIVKYAGYKGTPGSDINSSLQDTVLSDASQVSNKAQSVFLLYQALVSRSTFVVGPSFPQTAEYDTPAFRLMANKRISHLLTALCIVTGFTIIILFRPYNDGHKVGAPPSVPHSA